jgi:hypothetical protein
MAIPESSGSPLDANSASSKVRPHSAAAGRKARSRTREPSDDEGLSEEERMASFIAPAVAELLRPFRQGAADAGADRGVRFDTPNDPVAAQRRQARAVEPQDFGADLEVMEEEYEDFVESLREGPLARRVETERIRMILIDSLLAALDATFGDEDSTHQRSYRLTAVDPSLIVVLVRKMLGRIINRLDPIYVDRLIAATLARQKATEAPEGKRTPSSQRGSTSRRKPRGSPSNARGPSSAVRTRRIGKASRGPSRRGSSSK